MDGEFADRMDDGREDDSCNEVGGREYAGGGFVLVWHQGSLDDERACDVDGVGEIGYCFCGEGIVNVAQKAMACSW